MAKSCKTCGVVQAASCFTKCAKYKDGLNAHCKSCSNAHQRKRAASYRAQNRTKINAYHKIWRHEHKENISRYGKNHSRKTKKKISDRMRIWHAATNQKRRPIIRAWWEKNMRSKKAREVRELADWYVRDSLCHKTCLRRSDIPNELVELKRAQLLIRREIKERRK